MLEAETLTTASTSVCVCVSERIALSREIAIGFLPSPQFDIDGFVGNGVPGVEGISGRPRGSDYRGRHGGVLSQTVRADLLRVNHCWKALTLGTMLTYKSTSDCGLTCTLFHLV